MRTRARVIPTLLAVSLVLVACGDGDGDGSDDVASLGGDGTTTTTAASDRDDGGGGGGGRTGDDAEFQDAMLEFAECMRDEGIDFPDPEVGDGGAVIMGGPGPDGPGSTGEMEAAQEVCDPILEDARGSMPRPSPEQEAEMQDEMLAFSECMREHGIDFPDPEFSEDGGASIAIGKGGVDPEDPDFQQAQEECGAEGGFRMGTAGAGEDD